MRHQIKYYWVDYTWTHLGFAFEITPVVPSWVFKFCVHVRFITTIYFPNCVYWADYNWTHKGFAFEITPVCPQLGLQILCPCSFHNQFISLIVCCEHFCEILPEYAFAIVQNRLFIDHLQLRNATTSCSVENQVHIASVLVREAQEQFSFSSRSAFVNVLAIWCLE